MKREVWVCDRCKAENIEAVYHVDLGNDYSTPRETGENKRRVSMDLCGACWVSLQNWVKK